MKKDYKKEFFIHVIIPMIIGSMIYTLFRSENLLLFTLFEFLKVGNLVNLWREIAYPFYKLLPNWVIFSLPDGIWVYSLTIYMFICFRDYPLQKYICWILIGPVLSLFMEIAQYFNLIQGTFDINDVVIICIAAASAYIVVVLKNRQRLNYNDLKQKR